MTDARRPIHLAVLVGLSTGLYVGSIAGVTALQSAADRSVIADRTPALSAADAASRAHDDLASRVDDAALRYQLLASRYVDLGREIDDYEQSLDELALRADEITGSLGSLPTRIRIPSVPTMPAAGPRTRPATHATTGASG